MLKILGHRIAFCFGRARPDTPRVNSLESAGLLTNNPNDVNPFRIVAAYRSRAIRTTVTATW